jgi:hypothetical protein
MPIGDDQQVGRRAEGGVLIGKKPGVHVAVWADDGQVGYGLVQLAGDAPLGRVRVKVAVRG